MATQGLVTVRSKSDGKVLMKIVAGCDGYNAQRVANILRASWPVSVGQAYTMAREIGFGSNEDLVVITATEVRFDGDYDLGPLYRSTFEQPEFNPRWEHGTADNVVVIDV